MYKLFEVSKILSLAKPGGIQRVNIEISAYTESESCNILALVCDNGYLLFRHMSVKHMQPSIRQLNWFHDPEKRIKALSFDPSGNWLLLISGVATIYILPVLHLLDPNRKLSQSWRLDNITEIKLNVPMAPVTCVRWWQTLQGQQIAVIGSELGEISFLNLTSKKEVIGTYITVGIASLDILNDESHDTTYLLITGCNRQQWRLLLEEKKSDFLWPFSSAAEAVSCNGNEGNLASNDDKNGEQRPHRLSKFESGTFLTPQSGSGQNLVSAYNSSSCLLQVLEGDLDHMHLFSYKVPANCDNIMLSDKLIFMTQNYQSFENGNLILRIFSRKLAEICSENSKKKEYEDAEVQNFSLSDEVLAMYKQILHYPKLKWMQKIIVHNMEAASHVTPSDPSVCFENESKLNCDSYIQSEESFKSACNTFPIKGHLDGCLIILRGSVWECRPRVSPESMFLRLTATTSDLPFAEKLGVMLGLDIHKLYEIAADIQLSCGQFAQAVHLYQLSKCPQLKRVAHFMSYGFLSELIAYIQVLFSTKSMELVAADKCHFANIAVHCFSQQTMEKVQERQSISIAFKKFLRENMYYDEEVALKLLAEQGLHDLLYYLAKMRGQQGLMVETLFSIDGIKDSISCASSDVLVANGYENILVDTTNEDYMKCMTSFHLLQFLASKPNLLSEHLQHLIALLPKMNIELLIRVVSLYDPSRLTAKLAFRNIAASKHCHRYWSIDSIASFGSDVLDFIHNDEESTTEEDVIKFFIFVLLMLCHKMNRRRFDRNLVSCEVPKLQDETVNKCSQAYMENQFPSVQYSVLSCGLAHSALICDGILYMWGKSGNGRLGNGAMAAEYQEPEAVNLLVKLQVKVLSVSCGASHTLALTDCGVFAWGSSHYGQLGAGQVQRTCQPIILESLLKETIVAVQCGQYHSLSLTKDGRVYSWGWGVHGQLGHGNPEDLYLPKVIEYLKFKPVMSLAAGQGHSVVLSQAGEVYTFGCGMFGQLGTGSVIKCSRPQAVVLPESVRLVASGFFHVVAICKRQNIYSWGCNPQALRLQAQNSRRSRQHISSQHSSNSASSYRHSKGATTILSSSSSGNLQQTHLVPNLVDSTAISSMIIQVSCGSQHSSVLTLDGEVFTWGRNTEGQIGNGTRREQKIPSMMLQLNDRKLVNVTCGADFTIALDSIGKVWGWGQNDSGQLGKKPTSEINTKPSSSSSSGRIITIRTNRRMITITQPCRQGLLRPVEIIIPHEEIKIDDFNNGSFDTEYSISRLLFHQVSNNRDDQAVPDLSVFDNPCYGPYALHAALKVFHNCCDSAIILNHCISFSDFQAAAKVCSLECLYAQALEYQLKALISDPSLPYESYLTTSLEIIEFYSRMIDPENSEANMKFVEHVIKFWVENKLQLPPLEKFFQSSIDFWSYPLSLILFSDGQFTGVDSNAHLEFLSLLSSKFCLNIVSAVISQIQNGKHHSELMEHMMSVTGTSILLRQIHAADALTAWDDSIPAGRLWQELLHNMQKGIISHSTIHLTAGDVDVLTKSLMSERLCHQSFHPPSRKESKILDHGSDVIVFTCGHHYTIHNFRSSVLPSFRDSMQKLPYPLPQTTKLLFSGYQVEGVVPAACPRCVLTEIKSEL